MYAIYAYIGVVWGPMYWVPSYQHPQGVVDGHPLTAKGLLIDTPSSPVLIDSEDPYLPTYLPTYLVRGAVQPRRTWLTPSS